MAHAGDELGLVRAGHGERTAFFPDLAE
jgi:hypothetical protein